MKDTLDVTNMSFYDVGKAVFARRAVKLINNMPKDFIRNKNMTTEKVAELINIIKWNDSDEYIINGKTIKELCNN